MPNEVFLVQEDGTSINEVTPLTPLPVENFNPISLMTPDGVDISAANPLPVSEADGASLTLGATTDAAVSTDTTGTLSGKLRGLVKIFADVWDSVNHMLNVNQGASSSATDSIDVAKMSKGTVTTATTTATTSGEISAVGLNSVKVEVSGATTVTLTDCMVSGGTFVNSYNENGTNQHTKVCGGAMSFHFKGVSDYFKVTSSAAVTVKVQPLNL